jgi:hypothetical protein
MLPETLDKVKEHWLSENIVLAPSCDKEVIHKQFRYLGVNATPEILEVFSKLNGFAEDDMDSECLSFWTIDKIVRENQMGWVKDRLYVHFADFLIDSHTHAFKINDSGSASVYCHWDSSYVVKICESFQTFFEYYLFDTPKLWPS